MKNKLFVDVASFLLIFLFVYTAASKVIESRMFVLVLNQSPLIGQYASLVAWLLVSAELVTVALLFLPATRLAGLWFSEILLIVFTAYIAYMIFTTPHLPCSCGGVIRHFTWRQHLWFNGGWIAICSAAIVMYRKGSKPKTFNRVGNFL